MSFDRVHALILLAGLVAMLVITLWRQQSAASDGKLQANQVRLFTLEARLSRARLASEEVHRRLGTTGDWPRFMRERQEVDALYPSAEELAELAVLRVKYGRQKGRCIANGNDGGAHER